MFIITQRRKTAAHVLEISSELPNGKIMKEQMKEKYSIILKNVCSLIGEQSSPKEAECANYCQLVIGMQTYV